MPHLFALNLFNKIRKSGLDFVLYAFILLGCDHNDFLKDESELTYYPDKSLVIDHVIYTSYLKKCQGSSSLMMQLTVENNSKSQISIDLLQTQLITLDGLSSAPIYSIKQVIIVEPNHKSIDTIFFEPINDLMIYKMAGLKGDYLKKYDFNLSSAISGGNMEPKIISLTLKEETYKQYLKTNGTNEKLEIFTIDMHSEDFTKQVISNLSTAYSFSDSLMKNQFKNNGHTHIEENQALNFQIRTNEILIGGVVIGIQTYIIDTILNIKFHVINHQHLPLSFDMNNVNVVSNGIMLSKHQKNENQKEITIMKGERMGFDVYFETSSRIPTSFILPIRYGNLKSNLLDSIPLIKFNLPI